MAKSLTVQQKVQRKTQADGETQGPTKLSSPQEKLIALLSTQPELAAKLLEAIETARYFISISFQKKKSPGDPHDLQHFWHRQRYPVNDVLPSLRHIANDYKAKEMPNAEVKGDGWY